jgi:ATP/ADP translocase/HEAT repeat protein
MTLYRTRLMSIFNVRSGEGQLVSLVLAYAILLYTANVLARTASYALFLAEFDAQSLPFTYIGVSIFATLVLTIYLKLTGRYSLSAMLIANTGFLLLTLLIYWLGLTASNARWLVFSLPIYFGVNNALTITGFWNLLGRLYNLQEGKRLFGLLSSGEHMATVAAGFLAPVLVAWVGTANLLLIGAFFMVATLAVLVHITRAYAGRMVAHDETSPAGAKKGKSTGELMRDRYVVLIFGLFTLFVLGIYFVDNIFYINVEGRFPDEDQLASFIGVFFGLVGGLSLFIQLFIAGRAINRYGVRSMILVTPAILSVFAVLYALFGTFTGLVAVLFWLALLANLFRLILDATDSAAVNVLYQPLPAEDRTGAQTVVNGVLYPISIGLAGLFLVLLGNWLGFDSVQLTYVLIPILALWLLVAIWLGRAYPIRLRQALKQRILGGVDMPPPDRAALEVLQEALNSPRPGPVIYALDVLEEVEGGQPQGQLAQYLPALLEHPDSDVRMDALRRIERLDLVDTLPAVRQEMAREEDVQVKGASLRVLAALGDAESLEELYPALEAAEPALRKGAVVGLLRSGDLEAIMAAGEELRLWMDDPAPASRILAAEALGEAGIRTLYRPLLRLLDDEEPEVRRAALQAAGGTGNPRLWPVVLNFLEAPGEREAAMNALAAGGPEALPALGEALARPGQPPESVARLLRVCGRIGGEGAIALLVSYLDYPEPRVGHRLLGALNRCNYEAGDPAEVTRLVREQVAQAAWILASLADLVRPAGPGGGDRPDEAANEVATAVATAVAGPALDLLRNALERSLERLRSNIFLLLSFRHDAALMKQVQSGLGVTGESRFAREQRAYALEIIELHVDQSLKGLLKPLMEDLSSAQRLGALDSAFPQERLSLEERVGHLAAAPAERASPWLRACALYAAGRLSLDAVRETAVSALSDRDPLLRETAVWTLSRIGREAGAEEVTALTEEVAALAGDASPAVSLAVRRYQAAGDDSAWRITVEKVIALKSVGFFGGTSGEVLADLVGTLDEVAVEAGGVVFRKGEHGDSLYIINEGRVTVHDGEHIYDSLAANDVFGEMALLDPAPRSATVTAEETTHLLRLEQEPFFELLAEHAEIGKQILQLLSRRIRQQLSG